MTILESLSQSISEERMAPYRQGAESNSITPFARYLWNTALGECLYPGLQALEITLRNSLHQSVMGDRGTENWFEEVLDIQDLTALEEIKNRITNHNIPEVAGQIVANSDFGFWIRLMNSRYENVLWPGLLRTAFPTMPNRVRKRQTISKRLNRIRAVRNRVFHYEPIWNDSSLAQKHEEIYETIGWINLQVLDATKLFDRFPEVYSSGPEYFEQLLSDYMSKKGLNSQH